MHMGLEPREDGPGRRGDEEHPVGMGTVRT